MDHPHITEKYRELVNSFDTQSAASKELSLAQGFLSELMSGGKFMSVKTAIRVEDCTGGHFKAHELSPDLWAYHCSTQSQDTASTEGAS